MAPLASEYIRQAMTASLVGGGRFTGECHSILRQAVPQAIAFLTTSCTDALELAALALDLAPGDEIVMPSWTFPSSANAFALRGAVPVFVDVDPDTLDIDPAAVAAAITARTRAVLCVHYAGISCEMDALVPLCRDRGLVLIEDAAQAYGAFHRDRPLGGIGDLGAFSFHGTKNVSCGEGGALMVGCDERLERVEIAWEKGTNRLRFLRGKADRYEWLDLGSSFLPSELSAALLAAQLRDAQLITMLRRRAWSRYDVLLRGAASDLLTPPSVPDYASHNGHIFAVRLREATWRKPVIAALAAEGIEARSHYEPLHLSPAGRRLCRTAGTLDATEWAAPRLLRLPLDAHITPDDQERVVAILLDTIATLARS